MAKEDTAWKRTLAWSSGAHCPQPFLESSALRDRAVVSLASHVLKEFNMMGNVNTSILLFGLLVLAMFWSQGGALKCYQCDVATTGFCTEKVTCKPEEDTCLWFISYGKNFQRCWKYNECHIDDIGKAGSEVSKYHCCQHDFCNSAGMRITLSKASMISGLLMVLVMSFLF
ncbi:CD59 glycoprotein [Antechinus flavipes]|uniref:CD59 glycoprotein n=1 Tax=Antechinus flavipes TaxID=38775 RepID=UPI002235501A|nr:CD59 glycoprotein [Antechinus flavipes]